MATALYDFDDAFMKLTRFLEKNLATKDRFRLPEEIIKPFESTIAPTSTDSLHDFVNLFGGEQRKGLFLRLDGPSIYLVVSTVLQFPPCPKLTRTVSFFMEILSIYKDRKLAIDTLRPHLPAVDLGREVKKRQKQIFSQVLARAKGLLFDESKHVQVRRLAARLLFVLCEENAVGWRNLIKDQKSGSFGSLFRHLDDYALRLIVADIIRHLMSQNVDMHDLWDRTDEYAMDFPKSPEIDANVVKKILDVMSGMDLNRAFTGSVGRIYHVAEFEIPAQKLHSARSDTLLTIDDGLTIFMPDRTGTAFVTYEVPVTEVLHLESTPSKHNLSTLRIVGKQDQGYLLLNGQKKAIQEIRLGFMDNGCREDFAKAFNLAQTRTLQNLLLVPSDQTGTQPKLAKVSVKVLDLPSETEEDEPPVRKDSRGANIQKVPARATREQQPSSGSNVQQADHLSDVFAREEQPNSEADSNFTKVLRTSQKDNFVSTAQICVPVLPENEFDDDSPTHSSPLKKLGKRKWGEGSRREEGATDMQIGSTAGNPTLSLPLQHANDTDFAAFQNVIPRANIAAKHSNIWSVLNNQSAKLHDKLAGTDPSKPGSSKSLKERAMTRNSQPRTKPKMPKRTVRKRGAEAAETRADSEDDTENPPPPAKRTKLPVTKTGKSALPRVSKAALSKTTNSIMDRPAPELSDRESLKREGGKHRKQQAKEPQPKTMRRNAAETDWEEGFQEEDHNQSAGSEDPSVAAKQKSCRPLKDKTNVPRNDTRKTQKALQLAKMQIVATKKPKPVSKPTEITAALSRPKRNTAKNYTKYVEPLQLENEGRDTSTEQEDTNTSSDIERQFSMTARLERMSDENLKQGAVQLAMSNLSEVNEQPEGGSEHVGELTADESADDGSLQRTRVAAPSSDPDHDSEPHVGQPRRTTIGKHLEATNTNEVTIDEEGIAEDSYSGRTQKQAQSDDVDKSFGSKLAEFAIITPRLPISDVRSERTPVGSSTQFIHNVNAARSSASKSVAVANRLSARLEPTGKRAPNPTSDAGVQVAAQSQGKSIPQAASAVPDAKVLPDKTYQAEDGNEAALLVPAPADDQLDAQEDGEEHNNYPAAAIKSDTTEGNGNAEHDEAETDLAGDTAAYDDGCGAAEEAEAKAPDRKLEIPETQSQAFIVYANAKQPIDKKISLHVHTRQEPDPATKVVLANPISLPMNNTTTDEQHREVSRAAPSPTSGRGPKMRDTQMEAKVLADQQKPRNVREAPTPRQDNAKGLSSVLSRSRQDAEGSRRSSIIHFASAGPENQGSPARLKKLIPVRQQQPITSAPLKDVQPVSRPIPTHANNKDDKYVADEQDEIGIVVEDLVEPVASSKSVATASEEDSVSDRKRSLVVAVDGHHTFTLSAPTSNQPHKMTKKTIAIVQPPYNDNTNKNQARDSLQGVTEDSSLTLSSTEHISQQESEFLASDIHVGASPEASTRRATRRTPRGTAEDLSEETNESEQAASPQEKIESNTAKDMAQILLHRPQQLDEISFYIQQQYPNAKEKITLVKTVQTDHLPRPKTALHIPNVFDARDPFKDDFPPPSRHEKDRTRPKIAKEPRIQHKPSNIINSNVRTSIEVSTMRPPSKLSMAPKTQQHQQYEQQRSSAGPDANFHWRLSQPVPAPEAIVADRNLETVVRRLPPMSSPQTPIPVAEYPTSNTPQPYLTHLYAATSPLPESDDHLSPAWDRRAIAQNASDSGDKTLFEPRYLVRNMAGRSVSMLSNEQPSELSSSPQVDTSFVRYGYDQTTLASDNAVQNTHQNFHQTLFAVLQDLVSRLTDEETVLRALVDQFLNGGDGHLAGIRKSAHNLIKNDSRKLQATLGRIEHRMKNSRDILAGLPKHQMDTLIESRSMQRQKESLLTMLDEVHC